MAKSRRPKHRLPKTLRKQLGKRDMPTIQPEDVVPEKGLLPIQPIEVDPLKMLEQEQEKPLQTVVEKIEEKEKEAQAEGSSSERAILIEQAIEVATVAEMGMIAEEQELEEALTANREVLDRTEKELLGTVTTETQKKEELTLDIPDQNQKSQISPLPSTDLPAKPTSSQDSPEVSEKQPSLPVNLQKLADDIRVYCRAPGAMERVAKIMCEGCPQIFPNYRSWAGMDPIPLMVIKTQSPGYIEALIPALAVSLQDSIGNLQWSAGVCIGITFVLTMLDMPLLIQTAIDQREANIEEKPKVWQPGDK